MACNRGDPRRRGVSVARQWEMACGSTEYYEVALLDELVYVTGGLDD
ncbi:MAG: hypothetical protein J5901_03835 [Pseudobutyrivibrio sp.]|nr:hypothetical protein [Pseudobutyrivibrio sp.]